MKKLKLCRNCLRQGHFTSASESSSCRYCHKNHNSLLHLEEAGATEITTQNNVSNVLNESAENSDSAQGQSKVLSPYSLY